MLIVIDYLGQYIFLGSQQSFSLDHQYAFVPLFELLIREEYSNRIKNINSCPMRQKKNN